MQKKKGDEPQTYLLFWLRGSGLGARKPAKPYCTVSLAPSFRGFSPLCDSGLGARKPAKPYCTVSLAPSFRGFSPLCTSAMGVSPNYQTKANKYTIIPAINEINSLILTKNFAGTSLLLHIYCISSEASIPTIQDRINTIIPDLFVAYAIAKEHNVITTTEVIILFFSFMPPLSLACNMTLPLFIVKHFEIRRCSLWYRILYSWIYCKRSHTFRTSKENLKLLLFFTNTI